MGEEVRDPERTIPRAIPIASITVADLPAVGVALLLRGPTARRRRRWRRRWKRPGSWGPVVRVGAAVASLGALLALIAGIGRTGWRWPGIAISRVAGGGPPRYRVPHHAEIALAAVVCVAGADHRPARRDRLLVLRRLVYYAIANASAFTQPAEDRRWPRALNILGLVGCVVLAVTLPLHLGRHVPAILLGLALLARWVRSGQVAADPPEAEAGQEHARLTNSAVSRHCSAQKWLAGWYVTCCRYPASASRVKQACAGRGPLATVCLPQHQVAPAHSPAPTRAAAEPRCRRR